MNNKNSFSRRDFIKLISLAPAAWFMQPLARMAGIASKNPNIIVIVFDAWAAADVSFYGYRRETMPNLERFIGNAIVFHNHYAAGTFTVPGTASLLTGTYPWSHRAFQLGSAITKSRIPDQVFAAINHVRSTIAYGQNKYADLIIGQAEEYIDRYIRNGSFDLENNLFYSLPFFNKDQHVAYASLEDNIFQLGLGKDGSLFLGPLYRLLELRKKLRDNSRYSTEYPRGVPDSTEDFTLKGVVDGVIKSLSEITSPAFVYLHFHPPHDPYRPTKDFINSFNDNLQPVPKPVHPLAIRQTKGSRVTTRKWYDQYMASWDAEVVQLFDYLKSSGLLDNSYVFLTSDHGEMFERGEIGHWTPLMFDPVMHIPLIVSTPGQNGRKDVHAYTSNVDILSTAASLAGLPAPRWGEGQVLPELGGLEDPKRSIFTVDAKSNPSFSPLTNVSLASTRGGYRLAYYNYHGVTRFEFYDLINDPEELTDIYPASPSIAMDMKDELLQKLSDVNRPYETGQN